MVTTSPIAIMSALAIGAGGVVMAVAVVKTGRLIAQLTSEVERKQWGLLQQLMRFFLLGYD